ncbi:hypothetical protein, partial [Sphingobacterium suaedae]
RQSRWYCRNRWESRSVPNFIARAPSGNWRGSFLFLDNEQNSTWSRGLCLLTTTDLFFAKILLLPTYFSKKSGFLQLVNKPYYSV